MAEQLQIEYDTECGPKSLKPKNRLPANWSKSDDERPQEDSKKFAAAVMLHSLVLEIENRELRAHIDHMTLVCHTFNEYVQDASVAFYDLVGEWRRATVVVSNVTARCIHPAYQKIIGLGPAVIPHILDDLRLHGPSDWFWALTAITRENPITEQIAGNLNAMTEAWLEWGRNQSRRLLPLSVCPLKLSNASPISMLVQDTA